LFDKVSCLSALFSNVPAEKRFGCHPHREEPQGIGQFKLVPHLPPIQFRAGYGDHVVAVGLNTLFMKGWHHQATMSAMFVAVDPEESHPKMIQWLCASRVL